MHRFRGFFDRVGGVLLAFACILSAPVTAAPPEDGDWIVVARNFGSIIAVDPATGLVRSTISGPDLFDPEGGVVGDGPSIAGSFETRLLQLPGSRDLLVRAVTSPSTFGLYRIDIDSGNRTLLPGTVGNSWSEIGVMIPESATTLIALSDNFNALGGSMSRVIRYNVTTGQTTVLASQTVGSGPNIRKARGGALIGPSTLVVAESGLGDGVSTGRGLFSINLDTGDRAFLSRLSAKPFTRQVWVDGVNQGSQVFGDGNGDFGGGSGPVMTTNCRSVMVLGGRILVGYSIQLGPDAYDGGIMEIDPLSGDRRLIVGRAFDDNGLADTVLTRLPTNAQTVFFDDATGIKPVGDFDIGLVNVFGDSHVFRYGLTTGRLDIVADLDGAPQDLILTDLLIYRKPACTADINGDGLIDFFDVQAYLNAYSQGCE
ncbi:MAG: hypothetical protein KF757_06355 [Phycisphaeraceae bacterium]|nr:hypothetical protein [Phycisphaeraceae bacterium]